MRELPSGRNNFVGGGASMQGMGIRTQQKSEYNPGVTDPFYENAGITRDDLDAMYIYDAFAPNIWYGLETWGLTEPGTGYEFTKNGKIGINGDLPVNTHGGHLSNGHFSGWNHMVEMYYQLSDQNLGKRQVTDANTVQWATPWGDSILMRRA
jgi:acetyl-CoA acetyltransferase